MKLPKLDGKSASTLGAWVILLCLWVLERLLYNHVSLKNGHTNDQGTAVWLESIAMVKPPEPNRLKGFLSVVDSSDTDPMPHV